MNKKEKGAIFMKIKITGKEEKDIGGQYYF